MQHAHIAHRNKGASHVSHTSTLLWLKSLAPPSVGPKKLEQLNAHAETRLAGLVYLTKKKEKKKKNSNINNKQHLRRTYYIIGYESTQSASASDSLSLSLNVPDLRSLADMTMLGRLPPPNILNFGVAERLWRTCAWPLTSCLRFCISANINWLFLRRRAPAMEALLDFFSLFFCFEKSEASIFGGPAVTGEAFAKPCDFVSPFF